MREPEFYDKIGGEPTIAAIVAKFYEGVALDPILRPLYPDADLTDAIWRLQKFIVQYWGGPDTYSQERGHPRLRMRHVPFVIGERERDAWLGHMIPAIQAAGLTPEQEERFIDYVTMAAHSMVNT